MSRCRSGAEAGPTLRADLSRPPACALTAKVGPAGLPQRGPKAWAQTLKRYSFPAWRDLGPNSFGFLKLRGEPEYR